MSATASAAEAWSGNGSGHCEPAVRSGILGGTFDPVHLGHLIVAQDLLERLGLDQVRFVPVAQPWMKKGRRISSAGHRLAMLELSLRDNPRFVIDLCDIHRRGVTYTVDTLADVRKRLGAAADLFFILGADALSGFARWRNPAKIIELATLVTVPRPGYGVDITVLETEVPGIGSRLMVQPGPCIEISANDIRRRVGEGLSIRYLVAPGVADYISRNRLYRP